MIIEKIVVGMLQVNCYIIGSKDSGKGVIIDPGDEPDRIIDLVGTTGLEIKEIICTHGHFDHIGAAGELKNYLGALVLLHREDILVYKHSYEVAQEWGLDAEPQPEPDLYITEGHLIDLGSTTMRVIHTPGHSPGSICLTGEGFVLTGDTLFAGSIGRTDFPGGDYNRIGKSFRMLMALDNSTKVMPGHGPSSTIGYERQHNPFAAEFLSSY